MVAGGADASTITVEQELTVTAKILPKRMVLVDPAGHIQSVVSNTSEDVMPEIYRGSISPDNRIDSDDRIMADYRRLAKPETAKAGVLYERTDRFVSKSPEKLFASLLVR